MSSCDSCFVPVRTQKFLIFLRLHGISALDYVYFRLLFADEESKQLTPFMGKLRTGDARAVNVSKYRTELETHIFEQQLYRDLYFLFFQVRKDSESVENP